MAGPLRVALLDLLVEREEFGHGGNMEVLAPLVERAGKVEVLLLTPQCQSAEVGLKAMLSWVPVVLNSSDVPNWNDDYPFVAERTTTEIGGEVRLLRVALPQCADEGMAAWLEILDVDVVVCTGSRRNVSLWEPWMEGAASLLKAAVGSGLPTLGICFGHQLLCKALGGVVERADNRSDAVHDLTLTESGAVDPLFDGLPDPVALFTHQDHVVESPKCTVLLCSAPHNRDVAVRVLDESGGLLPAWGVQFHPEAAKHRIQRSVSLGHVTDAEASSFEREHDGEKILSNFAEIVDSLRRS